MSNRIVERDGIFYLLEENKVVRQGSSADELLSKPEPTVEFSVGDRVEADGKLGQVVAKISTIYGPAYSVRHDDGTAFSYFVEDLATSEIELPQVSSVVDGLLVEADLYENMDSDTLDQIQEKMDTARALNLRARALASDSQLPFADRIKLDAVISSLAVDLTDLNEDEENALLAANEDYLAESPHFEYSDEIGSTSSWTREDASWLDAVAAEIEEEQAGIDVEAMLSTDAVALVENMDESILSDDETVRNQALTLYESKLGRDSSHWDQFETLVGVARTNRLADLDEKNPTKCEKCGHAVCDGDCDDCRDCQAEKESSTDDDNFLF